MQLKSKSKLFVEMVKEVDEVLVKVTPETKYEAVPKLKDLAEGFDFRSTDKVMELINDELESK